MKQYLTRLIAVLLSLLLFPAFSGCRSQKEGRVLERLQMWTLAERYPSDYAKLTFTATYEADGEPFCLTVTRSKKDAGSSKRVRETREVDGIVYALCESKQRNANGDADYTYYECYTGEFRYFIGRENSGFAVESCLDMDAAIALIYDPTAPGESIKLIDTEWDAYYRMKSCNLEILIRPDDKGAMLGLLDATHTAKTVDGETVYVIEGGNDIAFTNGTDSIRIRQANRAGEAHTEYSTLNECKSILALIGT